MTRFEGKIAAITGAASGMGRCITLRLAEEGATVFGIDVNADGLAKVRAEVEAAGGSMTARVTDISEPDECRAAIADCIDRLGHLDVLGNVAAISWMKNTSEVTPEEWRTMFAVNVDGTYFMCQAALPHLLESHGNIINFASNAGFMGQAYLVPYCATKGAIIQITRALAMEFIKEPIRVNAIAPGGTDTPMNVDFQLADDTDFDLMKPSIGFREFGRPEHIAALFAFVASDEAANIHGSIINADSGLTAA